MIFRLESFKLTLSVGCVCAEAAKGTANDGISIDNAKTKATPYFILIDVFIYFIASPAVTERYMVPGILDSLVDILPPLVMEVNQIAEDLSRLDWVGVQPSFGHQSGWLKMEISDRWSLGL